MNRIKNFFDLIINSLKLETDSKEFIKVETAINYIINAHHNHRHHDGNFFIYHPISVATILVDEAGCKDCDVICAALLHDVFEKCDVDFELFRDIFGEEVFSIVDVLTKYRWYGSDDLTRTINYVKRIEASCDECKILKLADRLDNHRKLSCRTSDKKNSYILKTENYFSIFAEKSENRAVKRLWALISAEITKMK